MHILIYFLIFLSGFFLFLPLALHGFIRFDEGFILTGAMLVRDGALPYRDFLSMYGPGQYYLTALLFEAWGETVLPARVAHAALLALLAVCVLHTAKISADRSTPAAILAVVSFALVALIANPNAGYPAITSTVLLFCAAMAFSRWPVRSKSTYLFFASALAGLAGLFRWDFGLFGLAAVTAATVVVLMHRRSSLQPSLRVGALALGPGVAIMTLVMLPLVVAAGPARWFEEVVLFSIFEFREWRNLEFIKPSLWTIFAALAEGRTLRLYDGAVRLIFAALPFLATLAGGLAIGWTLRRSNREIDQATALALVVALICLLLLNQMRVRPHFWQGFPAFVFAIPLATYAVTKALSHHAAARWSRAAMLTFAFVLSAIVGTTALDRYLRLLQSARLDDLIERAPMIRVLARPESEYKHWREYAALIQYLRVNTRPDEFIFSGVTDTSRLFINDALLYFLAARRPATRFVYMEPGITNTERGQRELVEALEHKRVSTIVLWNITSSEPNRTAISNGVHTLDQYIRDRFIVVRRFGDYEILTRREPSASASLSLKVKP